MTKEKLSALASWQIGTILYASTSTGQRSKSILSTGGNVLRISARHWIDRNEIGVVVWCVSTDICRNHRSRADDSKFARARWFRNTISRRRRYTAPRSMRVWRLGQCRRKACNTTKAAFRAGADHEDAWIPVWLCTPVVSPPWLVAGRWAVAILTPGGHRVFMPSCEINPSLRNTMSKSRPTETCAGVRVTDLFLTQHRRSAPLLARLLRRAALPTGMLHAGQRRSAASGMPRIKGIFVRRRVSLD